MCVAVATLWTSPDQVRPVDEPALWRPSRPRDWVEGMTAEERADLDGRTLSQLLLGERVQVAEVHGDWAQVVALGQPSSRDSRGYPGWLPVDQLSTLDGIHVAGVRVAARHRDRGGRGRPLGHLARGRGDGDRAARRSGRGAGGAGGHVRNPAHGARRPPRRLAAGGRTRPVRAGVGDRGRRRRGAADPAGGPRRGAGVGGPAARRALRVGRRFGVRRGLLRARPPRLAPVRRHTPPRRARSGRGHDAGPAGRGAPRRSLLLRPTRAPRCTTSASSPPHPPAESRQMLHACSTQGKVVLEEISEERAKTLVGAHRVTM